MVYVNPAGFPTPDLPNAGWRVFIALMVMIVAAGLIVTARLATRITQRQLGSDDWTILASLCMFLVQTTLWALAVRAGYGADYLLLADWQKYLFNKWWFLGSIFWLCTLVLYKMSVLLLLNRIFVQRPFKIVCWTLMGINAVWGVANILTWILQCRPVPAMWGQAPLGSVIKCIDQDAMWISIVTWDTGTDIAILLLPQPMIWRLSLKVREKFMLTGMFLLGAIVVVFSLMSCGILMSNLGLAATQQNQYTFALANLFQVLETGFGILGACLPVMRQPLRKLFPRCMGGSGQRPSTYYYDEQIPNEYGLHRVPEEKRLGSQGMMNSASTYGPDISRSTSRQTDELEIMRKTNDTRAAMTIPDAND